MFIRRMAGILLNYKKTHDKNCVIKVDGDRNLIKTMRIKHSLDMKKEEPEFLH